MFSNTRNTTPQSNQDTKTRDRPVGAHEPVPTDPSKYLKTESSIIGPDLRIFADDLKIISQSTLQLNGETAGEFLAKKITVGPEGKVTGNIFADTVVVHGEVNGSIQGPEISLTETARVAGELHHNSLEISRGAVFHGSCIYEPNGENLKPHLTAPAPAYSVRDHELEHS